MRAPIKKRLRQHQPILKQLKLKQTLPPSIPNKVKSKECTLQNHFLLNVKWPSHIFKWQIQSGKYKYMVFRINLINITEKQFQKSHAGENGQASRNNISCTIGQKKLNRWNHNGKREGMLRTVVELIFSK